MAKNRSNAIEADRDEVAEGVHEAFLFLQRNWIKLAIGAVVLLVAILVANSMANRKAQNAAAASNTIGSALNALSVIESTSDAQQRSTQVTTLVTALESLIKQYPDTPVANQAYFLEGRAYFELDDFEKAQQAYQKFIDTSKSDAMAARGDIALGYAYENQAFLVKDQDKARDLLTAALNSYEKAAQRNTESYLRDYALLGQARIQEALHEDAKAIALYKQVIADDKVEKPAAPADANAKPEEGVSDQTQMIRSILDSNNKILSFSNTAEERLNALEGPQAASDESKPETPDAATAQPAAGAATNP